MPKPKFKAFLSHRYNSPESNQRFFDLLSAHGDLQFEVDVGIKATNVTRLELLVRDADAFVGIYPFPSDDDVRPGMEMALKESRYFRFELDLALRARRPAVAFVDARYGTAITIPRTMRVLRYDHREELGIRSDRRKVMLNQIAHEFCSEVGASIQLTVGRPQPIVRDRVGIILPSGKGVKSHYSKRQVANIENHLAKLSLSPVHLNWQNPVDGSFLSILESLDWVIIDIGPETCAAGLPAFLHGHFIPQMRLLRTNAKQSRSPLETSLLAGFEVGYSKDIIRWRDNETLDKEFLKRLTTLYEPRKHIGTADDH